MNKITIRRQNTFCLGVKVTLQHFAASALPVLFPIPSCKLLIIILLLHFGLSSAGGEYYLGISREIRK